MDDTFNIVPELFLQLYTIHALGSGWFNVPCLYAFPPNKSREMYNRLFTQLKVRRPNMMPRTIMIDVERLSAGSDECFLRCNRQRMLLSSVAEHPPEDPDARSAGGLPNNCDV